jgi:hypothetical protein
LVDTLIFIENSTDLVKINKNELTSVNSKIFSFNSDTHKILEKEKISHEIAENYINKDDKLRIFDSTVSNYNWYERIPSKNLEFNGVNLLGMLDTAELHQLFIKKLTLFLIIKHIIEKEKPKKIITSINYSKIIPSINKIEIQIYENKIIDSLAWDDIEIKFNIGKLPISFRLSRTLYAKMKQIFESFISKIFNFWFKFDTNKTIILLEFDPSTYSDLLTALSKYTKNILIYNRRKPAIWNASSIKILHKTKSKLFNFKKLEFQFKKEILSLTNNYLKKLEKVWKNKDLDSLFLLEDSSFWYCIKDELMDVYKRRMHEYISLLLISKNMFDKINVSCILSSNLVGETEKSILFMNNNKIHSIMLEHGYANYVPEISRYDILSMYSLVNDKIATWGETQKKYLVEHKKFDNNRILVVGSPKHDQLFKIKNKSISNSKKTILLALHQITHISGNADTNSYVRYEKFLITFCNIVKNFSNVQIIVKLHPSQNKHTDQIKKLFKKLDSSIPVYHSKSINELIPTSDVLVCISPEGFDPSTVILEGIIQEKPVMNIILDNNLYEFQYVKDKAVLSVFFNDDLESNLKNILFDEKIKNTLIENGKNHIENYLSNPGNSSEYFAKVINSL